LEIVAYRPTLGFLRLQERPCLEGVRRNALVKASEATPKMDASPYLVSIRITNDLRRVTRVTPAALKKSIRNVLPALRSYTQGSLHVIR
jgi:hypothetical protein